jgi:radical SAM superfamily enzyme YgiQ (UPF0313 family)
MKRVLLAYPDFVSETKYNRGIPGNYSEGLASISAVLKEAGNVVELYHMTWMPERDEFLSKVKIFQPDIIGFSLRTTAKPFVAEMAGWLADAVPDIYVVCGGYHPTLMPSEVIAMRGVHALCIGEGEYPLLALCEDITRTDIPGMHFKDKNGQITENPVGCLIEDLDSLPFPDLDIFDFPRLRTGRINTAMIIVSRGCLFTCTYCGNAQFRHVYPNRKHYTRFRSPENAIRLIERVLEKQPNTRFLEFRDAIFNMFPEWFYEFMPLYMERIKLPFNCNLRFDLMDKPMAKLLAEAGCMSIDIGLECGNEAFRTQYLHRTMNNEHMIQVASWLREYGIRTVTYNIIGLPHETPALVLETIKLNARMKVNGVIANIFYPYPQTKLHQIAFDGGFLDGSVDSNDKVQLRQPLFSRDDVLYFHYKFHTLMQKYRKYYALPEPQANRKIAALDKRILSPVRPRWLLWRLAERKDKTLRFAKRLGSRFMPSLYLWLRGKRR